ncbi:MAG: cofactor-independent phosphoglycerate mutase [Bacteroidales bacterium]|nr:MAG: cofactor-independent phosphoglycerate mutase [Bacteroidales bacterium]
MKYIILIPDGMADWAMPVLGGRTPLMAANTPNLDELCRLSSCGRLVTIPDGMAPGSETANLSILGYHPGEVGRGRGVLEAASMGLKLLDTDLVLRCNLICIDHNGKLKNHSAGHISTREAIEIIKMLNRETGEGRSRIYPGVSYRHIFILENGSAQIQCTPPHDVPGKDFRDILIKPLSTSGEKTTAYLNGLILESQRILPGLRTNKDRIKKGKDPANSIWLWSPGQKPAMKPFYEKYNLTGAVISAVDLVKGIGIYAGFEVIPVSGATGLYDTDYEGKADAAIRALETHDLVYLHIEAPDEAGHEGDPSLKIRTIEDIDRKVTRRFVDLVKTRDDISIAILPDHPTPCEIRTHTNEPVPFLIYHPFRTPDKVTVFNEQSVTEGKYGLLKGEEFILILIQDPTEG